MASTAAGSVFSETTASTSHKGSRIAPLSTCSDLELDRMIRAQWRNNRHLFSENTISQISFSAVEKAVPGPKIVTKKTESKLKDRKDWEEAHKPSVGTYHIDDSITRADQKAPVFPKGPKMERDASPDFKRPLNVNLDAVRKVAPSV